MASANLYRKFDLSIDLCQAPHTDTETSVRSTGADSNSWWFLWTPHHWSVFLNYNPDLYISELFYDLPDHGPGSKHPTEIATD